MSREPTPDWLRQHIHGPLHPMEGRRKDEKIARPARTATIAAAVISLWALIWLLLRLTTAAHGT